MTSPKILVMCHTTVGSKMASGGIRAVQMARVLQEQIAGSEVTLAIPGTTPSDLDAASLPFAFDRFDGENLGRLARDHDIVISTRFPIKMIPYARSSTLILDLFTPLITEWVELTKRDPGRQHRRAWIDFKRRDLMVQMAVADQILVSNERQRDLLLGVMGTMGMISPRMFEENPGLDRLFRTAPMGVRPARPERGPARLRGVVPGIDEHDFVIIWNGVILDWYDIDLLLHAVHRLKNKHPRLKLFFMGTEHPDSYGAKTLEGLGGGVTKRAIALSRELGILDSHVIFNFTWADNDDTQQYLLESDIAVCTYFDSLETRYSFRVRYMDVMWAGLPLVCTQGDIFSNWVHERGMGVRIPEGDLEALTSAIDRLASDPAFREECGRNMQALRNEFSWEQTMAPLVEFCRDPSTTVVSRAEQRMPVATRTLDWLASRAYYEARFGLKRKVATWRKNMVARHLRREEPTGA
jgi:glycosyltransferase involved in cell wall biosynthesis